MSRMSHKKDDENDVDYEVDETRFSTQPKPPKERKLAPTQEIPFYNT